MTEGKEVMGNETDLEFSDKKSLLYCRENDYSEGPDASFGWMSAAEGTGLS